MTSTWAHLPGGQSCRVDICPALFNRLAVGPADAFHVIERIISLTRCSVAGEVEFGNEVSELQVLDIEVGVVFGNPPEVVDGPFTSNVIRDDNIADNNPLQYGRDNIICVYIPVQLLAFTHA